jgi:hypothetical protein
MKANTPSVKLRPAAVSTSREVSEVVELSPQQQKVLDVCVSGENVFFSGGAGKTVSPIVVVVVMTYNCILT